MQNIEAQLSEKLAKAIEEKELLVSELLFFIQEELKNSSTKSMYKYKSDLHNQAYFDGKNDAYQDVFQKIKSLTTKNIGKK
jgi:hypothetical protein